jgi:WD40 repeat protein
MIIEINSMENIQGFKYHNDMICLAILNKEEDSIISVGSDKRIRVFEITNAKESSVKTQEIYEVPQHLDKVTCVIFSSDKKKMITSGKGKDIKIWNTTTKELDYTIIGHTSSVTYLALSTDDNLLLSASQDMKLNLWNLKNYKKIISLKSETDVFLSCCFCNKNKFIIAGGNNCIKIWDIEKEKQVGAIQCTKTRADSLTLDKKQKYLVTASGENTSHHIETEKNSQLSARFKFFIWNFENFLKKIGLINEND